MNEEILGKYNLIFTDQSMFLSSKQYNGWREIQEEYEDYKASLSFDSLEEVSEYIIFDYKLHEPFVAKFLADFRKTARTTIEINLFDLSMKGVLLVNLGSPQSPDPKDVKPYLDQFLMDKYVIDVPYLLRALLVRGIILRKRPEASAEAYKKIWWEEGSPLIVLSERMHKKVQQKTELPVALAMRYGKPSIETGLQELNDKGVTEVMLFPLYPQYAMASTLTILVLAEKIRKEKFPHMVFTDVPAFYNKPDYIQVLANSIKRSLEGFNYDHLLFSYHGIPERHIRKTDVTKSHCKINSTCCVTPSAAHKFCYRHQCYETTRLVVEQLGIPEDKYSLTFQSRLAGDKWLDPYTDVEINKMPAKGIKSLAVVTPAFVSDCLETLEEIAMRAREEFEENGGQKFLAVPCLNDNEEWVSVVANWINEWATAEITVN